MTLHNTILKRIQLIVLALLYGLAARAQTTEKYGTFFDDAIPITLSGNKSTFTDRRNTDKKPSGSHFYYIFRYIPLKGVNIAIHKERLFIISSTCLYREILLSITGKQTIRQDRVIPLFMF